MQSVTERLGLGASTQALVDVDTLKNAFEYDQAELSQEFLLDRRALIAAVQDIFVRMGVVQLDGIKRLVWTFIDHPPIWQVRGDAGWLDCDATTQKALNDAERDRLETVDVQFRAWTHRYNLTSKKQINRQTKRSRPLRQRSPWTTAAWALPRWQYETRNAWSDCVIDMQRALGDGLREAEREETAVVQVESRGYKYQIDFKSPMMQINVHTGKVRALRFGLPVNDPVRNGSAAPGQASSVVP